MLSTNLINPDELMGQADISYMFGVTRYAPAVWKMRDPTYPRPVAVINDDVELRLHRDVEAWGRKTGRRPLEDGRIYDDNGYDITPGDV